MSAFEDFTHERALILKSVLTFVAGLDDQAIETLSKLAPHADVRAFMRLNAGPTTLSANFVYVRDALQDYLIKRPGLSLPAEIRTLVTSLERALPKQANAPFFLSASGIGDYLASDPKPGFLPNYAGCWRVFRYSSDALRTSINQCFLNIRPERVLRRDGRRAPQFSFYYREGRLRLDDIPGKITGFVFPIVDRVTFIGRRDSEKNPQVFTMVLPAPERRLSAPPDGGMPRVTRAWGLMMGPNASTEHTASFCYALRLDKSETWDETTYHERRLDELAAVGSHELPADRTQALGLMAELMGGESDAQTFSELDQKGPVFRVG